MALDTSSHRCAAERRQQASAAWLKIFIARLAYGTDSRARARMAMRHRRRGSSARGWHLIAARAVVEERRIKLIGMAICCGENQCILKAVEALV